MKDMYRNVGDFKKKLQNVPDDYDIRYQRIEDVYFEKHGWDTCSKRLNNFLCVHKSSEPCDEYCESEYIAVHSIIVDHKNKIVLINAHY